MNLTRQHLSDLLERFRGQRVAVLGDLMLDRYYWGSVRRVSPEAPVPVVEVESESTRFGGAANVAHNIASLGGEPVLIGLLGDDHPGEQFIGMMRDAGLDTGGVLRDAGRQTTIKTRVIAHSQHVVRIDTETKTACPEHLVHGLIDAVKSNIHSIDAVLIEDYNKGVLSPPVIQDVVSVAKEHGKIVTVDPKFENFLEYRGVTVFKPNRREVEEVLGGRLKTRSDVERAGKRLLEMLSAENVLLTRGDKGMTLCEAGGATTHWGTVADSVQDVSGAGDTVISTLTMALAAGAPVQEACVLANYAGGVVVGSVGIVPIDSHALLDAVLALAMNLQEGR
jgi:D-beta-D-heptose 7-phosphate kinase/D-beta-D-heptose 1-phosphate adenosyltransferase